MPSLRGPSALLRLQSDERLIALTRRSNPAAFEVLCARYQTRLLAFCRHMLSSREDAEDVLQEVFAAAYNAVLADEREINVRPWLYRIARNRSLNHLRRVAPIGVDTMDLHYADSGLTTSDKVMRRENFRELIADVQDLPETQRTALLLREIDALSYEQIAHAMETTIPSVKSLLVRARISLAEASEARKLSCEEVRLELGEVAEGLDKLSTPGRRHVRGCERCRTFRKHLKDNNRALAAIMPVAPLFLAKKLLLTKLGSTASAGGAHVAGGAGATMGAGASAAGAGASAAAAGGGMSFAGGVVTAGAGAIATKAVAGLAAAALVTAGAVAADHAVAPAHRHAPRVSQIYAAVAPQPAAVPQVIQQRLQPASSGVDPARHHSPLSLAALKAAAAKKAALAAKRTTGPGAEAKAATPTLTATSTGSAAAPVSPTTGAATPATPGTGSKTPEKVTEVTSESTHLPSSATEPAPPSATPVDSEPTPAGEAASGTTYTAGAPTTVADPLSGGTPAPSAEGPGEGTEGTPSG